MCCSAKESFALCSKRPVFGGRVPALTHFTRIFGSVAERFATPIVRGARGGIRSEGTTGMSGSSATLARVGWDGRAMDEAELRDDEVEVLVVDDRVDSCAANDIASLSGPASGGVFLRRAGSDVLLGTCDSGLRSAMLERRFTASARQAATAALGDDILATLSGSRTLGARFALESETVRVTSLRAAFLTRRACRNNRAHRRRELFTALLRHAAADDGGLGAGRCRLKASSLTRWLGTGKSSGTHARALTPACFMPASGSALFLILLQSYGDSADNSAPLPVSA